jgi:CBS domain-containing protein
MKKGIITIDSNDTIKNACNLYKDNKIGSLLVIENKDVVGIVTERDIIERTICLDKDPKTTPIKEIMSGNVKTVDVDDRINYAVDILRENNIKKLPVTENGELVGIITVTDIAYSRPNIRKFLKPGEN